MSMMNRRQFLAVAAAAVSARSLAQRRPRTAVLTLHPDKPICTVPQNFVGLSFELQQLCNSESFSPDNKELVAQFRALAPRGVVRMGGNTSDFGYWKPAPDSPMPQRRPAHAYGKVEIPDDPFPVTPEALRRLRGFLDATNWDCIYGINLATNVPSVAVEEAAAVTGILGARLVCLQIGNEADRYAINFRRDPQTWGPEPYYKEWLDFAQPIVARLPNARLGVPDMAAKPDWFAAVTRGLLNSPLRSHIVSLSYHYYIDGPASNPKMNIANMLRANAGVIEDAGVVSGAATTLRTGWRMTEGNTCYSGGKPGVSDVFASALWSADYLLLHASLGCAGVNLHGGIGKRDAKSRADKLPGDNVVLMKHESFDDHPHPYYSPIALHGGQYVAEPVSYGMRFASRFAGSRMIAVNFNPGPVNATAYACILPTGKKAVAIINKDDIYPVEIDLPHFAVGLTLAAPALNARTAEIVEPPNPRETSVIPPASAMLLYESRG